MDKQMQMVNHLNKPDNKGRVYCRKLNKIIAMNSQFWDVCTICPMFSGTIQGEGVECTWDESADYLIVEVFDPKEELLKVSKLIDQGVLKKL